MNLVLDKLYKIVYNEYLIRICLWKTIIMRLTIASCQIRHKNQTEKEVRHNV